MRKRIAQTIHKGKQKAQPKQMAKLILQLSFLAGVCYVGGAVSQTLPVPIPSNIVSMAILLILLATGMIQASKIDLASGLLLKYMPVFFVPAGVTVLGCYPVIAGHIWQFALICVITTILVYCVTSYTVSFMLKLQAKRAEKAKASAGDTSEELEVRAASEVSEHSAHTPETSRLTHVHASTHVPHAHTTAHAPHVAAAVRPSARLSRSAGEVR